MSALATRLADLRRRLDAVLDGRTVARGVLERARGLLERAQTPSLETLRALDQQLDRAGVHTSADASLLKQLGALKGRLGQLAPGLQQQAEVAVDEFEAVLRRAERQLSAGPLNPGVPTALAADFRRLARVVKVAVLFADADGRASMPLEIFGRGRSLQRAAAPRQARLAVAEFWADRAQGNVDDLLQKRRDLDLAHELLLRQGASPERERLQKVRLEVADARARVRSAPVVRSLNDLVRHLRHVARKEPQVAWRSLRALYERAVEAGDQPLAEVAWQATASLMPEGPALQTLVERGQALRELGWKEPPADERAAQQVERARPRGQRGGAETSTEVLAQLAYELDERMLPSLELAAGVSRYFDVEDALSEQVVEADLGATRPVQRRVGYPTQLMTYEFTSSLAELPNFVIAHPGLVVHDLASNTQLVRAYLEEQPPPKPRRLKKTAVRVYVLDASGSMHGPRAHFRDAVLIAELNSIRLKARQGLPFDPLYFSFFNDAPTELSRVDSGAEALRFIEKLFSQSPAQGQTDITLALMSAFDSIRAAQGTDPYLARATVVLVTDGEDAVDLEVIRRARKPLEGLDIALSFISLGEENPDLRTLVREQREQGGRAFYHHLSDAEVALAPSQFDSTFRTLLPPEVSPTPAALELLWPHLEALEAIAQGRAAPSSARSDGQFAALFPPGAPAGSASVDPATVLRVADILDAIGEATSLAPADQRPHEAVSLLHHLLQLYGLSLPGYLEVLGLGEPKVRATLERLRLVARPY